MRRRKEAKERRERERKKVGNTASRAACRLIRLHSSNEICNSISLVIAAGQDFLPSLRVRVLADTREPRPAAEFKLTPGRPS